jgi:hypothetical protein
MTIVGLGRIAGAQAVGGAGWSRWSTVVAIDAGTFPDALENRCGNASKPSVGAGIAAVFRPRSWLVLTGDTRGNVIPTLGCGGDLVPPPMEIAPNVYENPFASTVYQRGLPGDPFFRSGLHLGVEVPTPSGLPPGEPLLRATVGTGLFWATRPVPYTSAAIGISSRNRGNRLYVELETNVTRIRADQSYARMRRDSTVFTPLPARVIPMVLHPRWTTLHVGIEVPIAAAR